VLPSKHELDSFTTVYEYRQRETDPYLRILNLKEELITAKKQIDEYAERFKDNTFVKETDNLSLVLEELDLYKTKIDAFLNYDLFNKSSKMVESDEEGSQKSNSANNSAIMKNEFNSIFEKYNRISDNLISQIKSAENGIINNQSENFHIKYEIVANPDLTIEHLTNKIAELEDKINYLEKAIGNWSIVRNF
jgi:hypothetical protein